MPRKADKSTQNSALQGISEQENFMIKVLFICHLMGEARFLHLGYMIKAVRGTWNFVYF